jgi:prepilin-type N-terminal cleavage/methylation domain-containing protein
VFMPRTCRPSKASEKGFSLVELIVVVAILGILVIVAIPVYGAIQSKALEVNTQKAANQVLTSATAMYQEGGDAAVASYLNELNTDESPIFYTVSSTVTDRSNEPGHQGLRSLIEYDALVSNSIVPSIIRGQQSYSADTGSTGQYFCVVAFAGKGEKFDAIAYAGFSCGRPFDASFWPPLP